MEKSNQQENLFILCVIIYLFIPTSINGRIFDSALEIPRWIISICIILWYGVLNKINGRRLLISLFLILYLSIASFNGMINYGGRFSIARVTPVITLLLLLSIDFKCSLNWNTITRVTKYVLIILAVWGFGLILRVPFIQKFTINFFSQSYQTATSRAVSFGKPVFSFGIHTRASFFYMAFFYYFYDRFNRERNYYLIIGCLICLVFCFFLTSNSSLLYSAVMAVLLLWLLKGKPHIIVIVLIITSLLIYTSLPELIVRYQASMSSSGNGFAGRYGAETNIYDGNFQIIKESIGVGFTIPTSINVEFADAGWIMFLTMGNVVLMAGIYYLLFKAISTNIGGISGFFYFLIILSFEFIESGMWYNRFVFFYIIFTFLFKTNMENSNNVQIESKNRKWKIVFRGTRNYKIKSNSYFFY